MKLFIQKHFISIAISVVFILVLMSACLSYYNEHIMNKAERIKQQADVIKRETENLSQVIRNIDVSIRGYALMKEDRFLFLSVEEARQTNRRNITVVDSLLHKQGYQEVDMYEAVKQGLTAYIDLYEQMIPLVQQGNMTEFNQLLSQDRGKQFWKSYEKFTAKLFAHEDFLYAESKASYEAARIRNNGVQLLLLLIGLPTLVLVLQKLQADEKNRKELLKLLADNNEQYLFNAGKVTKHLEEEDILEQSIDNLKKAADFIYHISEGNYRVEWQGLTSENKALNQNNLVGRLILMREQMKKVKQEDEKRLWNTEGISHFSDVIRKHQYSLPELCYQSLVFLIKYLHAQRGSLFIYQKEEGQEGYLEIAACYAFERKKHLKKRIEIREGIVGQAYLEAETIFLTDLPQHYTSITSGLGGATPSCLLIVPMKYNEKVQAILEIAAFQIYEPYQIAFVEKAGEYVASAIAAAQSNETTQILLTQFKMQTEQLRLQEEQMRQNMEELEATQEEMGRKEQEIHKRLQEIR